MTPQEKRRSDLRGQTIGRLFCLRDIGSNHRGRIWYCLCSCGRRALVLSTLLMAGQTKSCGCLRAENGTRLAAGDGALKGRALILAAKYGPEWSTRQEGDLDFAAIKSSERTELYLDVIEPLGRVDTDPAGWWAQRDNWTDLDQ